MSDWHKTHIIHKGGRHRKFGPYRFLRTGIVPKGKDYIARMADTALDRVIADLGGLEHISGNQFIMIREIRQLLIFKFLVDEKLMEEGIFMPGGNLELQGPLNKFYLSCSNSITRNCNLLGLKKVSIADDLQGYLAKRYARSAQKKALSKDTGQAENVPPRACQGPKNQGSDDNQGG